VLAELRRDFKAHGCAARTLFDLRRRIGLRGWRQIQSVLRVDALQDLDRIACLDLRRHILRSQWLWLIGKRKILVACDSHGGSFRATTGVIKRERRRRSRIAKYLTGKTVTVNWSTSDVNLR